MDRSAGHRRCRRTGGEVPGRRRGACTMTGRRDEGSAMVELTLIVPALVVMLLFVVALGRISVARGDVDGAARDAARAASIARSRAAAETDAVTAASSTLAGRGVTCRKLDVAVDTTLFKP